MRLCLCLHRYSIFAYSFHVTNPEECKQEENEEFRCNIFDPKEFEELEEEDEDYYEYEEVDEEGEV